MISESLEMTMPVPSGPQLETPPAAARRRIVVWLAIACLVGALATVPYAAHLARGQLTTSSLPVSSAVLWVAAVVGALFNGAVAFGLGVLGLILGERISHPVDPVLARWGARRGVDRRLLVRLVVRGLVLGLAAGGVALLADHWSPTAQLRNGISVPSPGEGLFASIGAGLIEEVLCRLGLLTLFAWMGARLLSQTPPGSAVFWASNVLAGVIFGSLHLPQAYASLVQPDALVLLWVVGGNLGIGLLCGWLYWRFGLLAAMAAHCGADLVLHVLAPVLPIQ